MPNSNEGPTTVEVTRIGGGEGGRPVHLKIPQTLGRVKYF